MKEIGEYSNSISRKELQNINIYIAIAITIEIWHTAIMLTVYEYVAS